MGTEPVVTPTPLVHLGRLRTTLWRCDMRMILVAISASLATSAVVADEPLKAGSPAAKLAALRKEVKELDEEFYKSVGKLEDTKDGRTAYGELCKECEEKQVKRYEAALELAKADPKSDTAFDAVEWLLTTGRVYHLPVGKPALQFALEHFTTHPKIGRAVLVLGQVDVGEMYQNHNLVWEFVGTVGAKNADKTVRGQAAIVTAWKAKYKSELAELDGQSDADELATVAEKAFEKIIADFGECQLLGRREKKRTLGEVVKRDLFELKNLRVGKVAPDIVGEDLDGVKFKLSDYRGKVVLLTFWGDW